MKIFQIKEAGKGENQSGQWTRVTFVDQSNRMYSSFDAVLLDLADGTEVEGKTTITEKDGKTYYNFKLAKTGISVPLGREVASSQPLIDTPADPPIYQNHTITLQPPYAKLASPGYAPPTLAVAASKPMPVDVNAAMARAVEFVNAHLGSEEMDEKWGLVELYTKKALNLQKELLK